MRFPLEKRNVVLLDGVLNGVMLRIKRLDEDAAREFPAARAAGHLRQQLKRPLRRPKIRQAQRRIRGEFLDTAAWSAPCLGLTARCAHREILCAAFLPDARSLRQKNKHTSTGTSDTASVSAGSIRSNGTPAGCAACDASSRCCSSRIAPTRRSFCTRPTMNIRAG